MRNKVNTSTKSDNEWLNLLSRWWKMDLEDLQKPFKVIARFVKSSKKDVNGRDYGYFMDVRNLNGDILYYPMGLGLVKIFCLYRESFDNGEYWQINVKLDSRNRREKYNNPFLLTISDTIAGKPKLKFVDKLNKEKFIKKIFEETGSTPRDAKNISNALHAIMGDLYTETERFVFELLQNADDQPQNESLVNVTLKTLNENLLFMHTGKPFTEADVESISSIGDSTKKKDSEKTGYKGIGFKSVFSDAETVFIDSGNFSFAFDKNSPLYGDEEDMDVIPWQIKPIWEEKYRLPVEVQENQQFFNAPVGIALNVDEEHIANYNKIIPNLLSEPRFVLFLRNVGKIVFENGNGNTIEISKTLCDDIVKVSSTDKTEEWIIKDYIINIPDDTRDAMQSEKLIPAKLKEATKTKITFAAKVENQKIVPVDDAVLFTYLPTKVDDFKFGFLVNADFLTTASRESIHFKNIWNKFLFSQIGNLLVDWVSSLSNYNGVLNLLPQTKYDGDNLLAIEFYQAFQKSLETTAFIKSHKGTMLTMENIMLDKSGLSKIIGKDLFCKIVDDTKSLPLEDIDEDALKSSELCENITKYTPLPVLNKIYRNTLFVNWFKEASDEKKSDFYDWLVSKDTEKRHKSIVSVVETLPIYRFGGNVYLSKEEVLADSSKIVIRNGHERLLEIFKLCGYDCSDNIDKLPISEFYSDNVIKSTYSYIFDHLLTNLSFHRMINDFNSEQLHTLIEWLDFQDSSSQKHKIICDFVNSLPLYVFNQEISKPINKTEAEKSENKLIITNKLEAACGILSKIGLDCSRNIEKNPLRKFIELPKEIDIFERIKNQARTALSNNKELLSPQEKITLFNVFKTLEGVGDTELSQILIFSNHAGTHRKWLSIMTAYCDGMPQWMYEYTISKSENFEDLQKYLVSKERIFEDIIKPAIDDVITKVSLKDLYIYFKDSWNLQFSKKIIDSKGINLQVFDLVEQQDSESKKYLLQKISSINIKLDEKPEISELGSRTLKLAFEVYNDDELRDYAKKIMVGERSVSTFTVSDQVSLEYHDGKTLALSLSKLLPSYQENGVIQRIKTILSCIDPIKTEKMLSLSPMPSNDVWNKVDTSAGHTPSSYLLGIYRTRKVRGYYNGYVPYVDLSQQSSSWINELMGILYAQKVELYNDSFGYRLSSFFGKYFNNEFVIEEERILRSIEDWADSDEKRSYLHSLGAKGERSGLVKARKAFIENEEISATDIDLLKDEFSNTVTLLRTKGLLPATGDNQKNALLTIEPSLRYLSSQVDLQKLSTNSYEYSLPEYNAWKNEGSLKVYLFAGMIPYNLVKSNEENLLLCSYEKGDYYYDSLSKVLYINADCEIRDILYSIVSSRTIPFSSEDWQTLFYDNLATKEEVENKQKEIDELKDKLNLYIQKYGEIKPLQSSNDTKEESKNDEKIIEDDKVNVNKETKEQDQEKKPSAEIKGNNGSASKRNQYAAQLEAQQFLMEQRPDWSYPEGFGECDESGKPLCFSTFNVRNENGDYMPIVLKSYKSTGEPFKINPEEWECVAVDSAKLLVYTYLNSQLVIVEVPQTDLVKNQPNMTISFSTDNLDGKEHEDRLSLFAEVLHYFKELTFDFTSFHVSPNAVRVKDIFAKNQGTAITASLDDL